MKTRKIVTATLCPQTDPIVKGILTRDAIDRMAVKAEKVKVTIDLNGNMLILRGHTRQSLAATIREAFPRFRSWTLADIFRKFVDVIVC